MLRKLKKFWDFLWKSDSFLSWLLNIIIAFILVKYIIYPGLGLILGTNFPIVAVVSSSMEHNTEFEKWWQQNQNFYQELGINKEDFITYTLYNGFNKGDIIVLYNPKNLKIGDIAVYQTNKYKYPIIHRLIRLNPLQTKGDNNRVPDKFINKQQIVGKALFKIPILGWVKIWFNNIIEVVI